MYIYIYIYIKSKPSFTRFIRFSRFTRFSRWMPKIPLTPVWAMLGVLAAGFLINSFYLFYSFWPLDAQDTLNPSLSHAGRFSRWIPNHFQIHQNRSNSYKSININEQQCNPMITATNHMQFHENHQRTRKSKSNSCLHIFCLQVHDNDTKLHTKQWQSSAQAQEQEQFIWHILLCLHVWSRNLHLRSLARARAGARVTG